MTGNKINPKRMYLIKDEEGKVVAYYRNKVTAITNLSRLKKVYGKSC